MRRFRSRIVMARHGFGRGEYKYFAYPLPDPIGALRAALYRRLAPVANRWNAAMGIAVALSRRARGLPRALPWRRPDAADAAAAALWPRRLQLPAPGSLRRARLPAAGRDPAVRARPRLHRRRVRADGAAAAHAVARRGGAAAPGRRRRSSPSASAPCRGRAALSRRPAPRRQPVAQRRALHARRHLPRCGVTLLAGPGAFAGLELQSFPPSRHLQCRNWLDLLSESCSARFRS